MRLGIWLTTTALVVAGVGVALDAASAAGEESPMVRLAGDDPGDVSSKAAEMLVVNDSVISWSLELRASAAAPSPEAGGAETVGVPVSLSVAGGEPVANSKDPGSPVLILNVPLTPPSAASDGTVKVVVDLPGERTGAGELIVVATTDTTGVEPVVLRRAITTTAADPVPAVASAEGFSADGAPYFDHAGPVAAYVPLSAPGPCPAASTAPNPAARASITRGASPSAPATAEAAQATPSPEAVTVGEVSLTDGSRALTAQVICSTDASAAAGRGAALQVLAAEVPSGAEFKGSLNLGDENVSVKLSRSDGLGWAVLVMLIGFVIAYLARYLSDVRRPERVLEWRVDRAGEAVAASQVDVNARLSSVNLKPGAHDIAKLIGAEVVELRQDLKAIRQPRSGKRYREEGDEKLIEIAERASMITAVATDWRSLPGKLESLRACWKGVPSAPEFAPLLNDATRALLDPSSEAREYSSPAARALLDEIDALNAVFKLIPAVEQAKARLGAYHEPPQGYQDLLLAARGRLNEIAGSLREAPTAKALVVGGIAAELEDLRRKLWQLPDPPPPPEPVSPDAVDREPRIMEVPGRPDRAPSLEGLLATWNREVERANLTLFKTDLTLFLVAAAIALWSGLTANYFGKAWGSALDYATIFFWAVTTSAVISALFDSVRRFGDRRFPS